ncbi:MAG: ATP-binding protein [Bacteroidetes bacterium]|nr:MAG: ATP-binding protein [Bacteroidota bacterium]
MNQPHTPVFLLPFYPPTAHFKGRQAELDSLHTHLQAGKRTVLVNGLGGVGKTTLAQKYVQEHEAEYAHILWLRQSGSIVTSFISPALFRNLGIELVSGEDMYRPFYDALRALNALQGKNLLIIDNYELTDTDLENDTLGRLCTLPTHWRVLCTSRNDVDFFDETMRLDVLPAHEAIQVFQANTAGKPADVAEVGELLKMISYHTLMTELLAKTYKQCLQFGTVGELHAYLKARSLQDQQLDKKIYVDRQATTLYAHLSAVFSLASLTEDETWLLKQWVVLPTAPHSAKDFLTWIQDSALAYENALLSLTEKGWLQTDNRLAYSLHPFLQLFLHQELKPTLPDCEKMWDYFIDVMDIENVQAHPLAHQWTIAVGEAMVQYIDFTDHEENQALLWNRICFVYTFLADYSNAVRCAKKNLIIYKTIANEKYQEYATSLNCLAGLYSYQGNYTEAEPLFQEALQIRKEKLGEQHLDYITSLNNLAYLYNNMSKYTKALPLYQKVLQTIKKELSEKHPNYAVALTNLANLYRDQSNYTKALPLYQEALKIQKKELNNKHPNCAVSLHNIGVLYFKQRNYKQARVCLEEAYNICIEKLGEQHLLTQNTKEWLDKLPRTHML